MTTAPAKTRTPIPAAVRKSVLRTFGERCAICGAGEPQLHHIDADPTNHDPLNLLPLCPNCHLTRQHDPLRAVDPRKLRLLRLYRQPGILRVEFDPLFRRLLFLNAVQSDTPVADLEAAAAELIGFVSGLQFAAYVAERLRTLLLRPVCLHLNEVAAAQAEATYRAQVRAARVQVLELICQDLLPYQSWAKGEASPSG